MAHAWLVFAALVLPVLSPAFESPEAPYPGCDVATLAAHCAWRVSIGAMGRATPGSPTFLLPAFSENLATLRVRFDAPANVVAVDGTWSAQIMEVTPNGSRILYGNGDIANGQGRSDLTRLGGVHTWTILFRAAPEAKYELALEADTPGDYSLEYDVKLPPAGPAPARPAASIDEPHLLGARGNARPGAVDIVAAWLDDLHLGDGIFEAHLAVANLSDMSYGSDPTGEAARNLTGQERQVIWVIDFEIAARTYHLAWRDRGGTPEPESCDFSIWPNEQRSQKSVIAFPDCAYENATSTLVARIPESALGNPSAGAPFIHMTASSAAYANGVDKTASETQGANNPRTSDQLDQQRFEFALGGPSVWDVQNGCFFCVEPEAWYVHPLAPESVPNTLQVLGAAAAAIVFLGGLVVVARRRRELRRLLDHVEGVAHAHGRDARAGLLAMGDLQTHFSQLMRHGDLHESHYQVLSQRIAFLASQMSMRRDLGLDDGMPGDPAANVGVAR